jgi:peroxiredoxin
MSLQDKLEKLRRRQSAEGRAAYQALVDQLARAETAARALKVGDAMPPFVLPNAEGRLVASDELLEQGPLVICFYRGDWCPYCQAMLAALQAAIPRITAAGGRLVALTPDTGGRPLAAKRRQRLTYEILSDVDHAVGLQFGVVFQVPEAYRRRLAEGGVDLPERHGSGGWMVPMPGTFVVDRGGIIRYAFVDGDFTRRAEPDAIVAVLEGLPDADEFHRR